MHEYINVLLSTCMFSNHFMNKVFCKVYKTKVCMLKLQNFAPKQHYILSDRSIKDLISVETHQAEHPSGSHTK